MRHADLSGGIMSEEIPIGPNPLPQVAGRRIGGSNADFERAALVCLREELDKGAAFQNGPLVHVLCEAVRLCREYTNHAGAAETKALDAKWLDPECHEGCQSLIFKNELAALKAELAIQPFAPIEHLASKAADEAWHTLAASDTHPSRKDHVRKAIESAIIAALHSHSKSAETERDVLKLKLETAKSTDERDMEAEHLVTVVEK